MNITTNNSIVFLKYIINIGIDPETKKVKSQNQ